MVLSRFARGEKQKPTLGIGWALTAISANCLGRCQRSTVLRHRKNTGGSYRKSYGFIRFITAILMAGTPVLMLGSGTG
jgi:hypothetical protein